MTLRQSSTGEWISKDGSTITIADQSTERYSTYLLRAGTQPVRLGEGHAGGVSDDGKWAVSIPVSGAPIFLHPTGAGASRELSNPDQLRYDAAAWLPDGRLVTSTAARRCR